MVNIMEIPHSMKDDGRRLDLSDIYISQPAMFPFTGSERVFIKRMPADQYLALMEARQELARMRLKKGR